MHIFLILFKNQRFFFFFLITEVLLISLPTSQLYHLPAENSFKNVLRFSCLAQPSLMILTFSGSFHANSSCINIL